MREDRSAAGRSGGLAEATSVARPIGSARERSRLDPDARWLAAVMHSAFFLLLLASAVRFLQHHRGEPRAPWVIALSGALAVVYGAGLVLGITGEPDVGRPTRAHLLWLGAATALWTVLVLLAPSFAWCAVPLFVTGLRTLPTWPALALVTGVTVLVVVSQNRLAVGFDPTLTMVPVAVAAVSAGAITHMRRQAVRLRESERLAGVLGERQRLSMEIHDALAQGLSSQAMLLQAADRTWPADPGAAHEYVRTAAEIGGQNLAEARRLVQDLAPSDLAGATLPEALAAVAARQPQPPTEFAVDGTPRVLPERVQSTLVRIAQGALANVAEHADAGRAALTLTYLDDQVLLDVADDGAGFPASAEPDGGRHPGHRPGRGHGLAAMRARTAQLGGTLTVESAPGQGTVISVAIPVEPRP
ncbi:sensor histidine kinase [Catenulispora sp. NL8]|uniref:Oxygen sensor histidine kinase NreB n=1 Tax=Catenulispora pinistramenti TaxID=2705254 RepID=A0ABS5KP40_9ACTN|nr:sensor histidine kinase [Catenulispora pinistramenti]MBS2547799.1 sensor histidine kinase [Catenulispora pinistramenti]